MSDVSKPALGDGVPSLPAWPEKPASMTLTHSAAWGHYDSLRVAYYRARMEALVDVVREHRHAMRKQMSVDEALAMDALLAACRRDGDEADGVRGEREEGR